MGHSCQRKNKSFERKNTWSSWIKTQRGLPTWVTIGRQKAYQSLQDQHDSRFLQSSNAAQNSIKAPPIYPDKRKKKKWVKGWRCGNLKNKNKMKCFRHLNWSPVIVRKLKPPWFLNNPSYQNLPLRTFFSGKPIRLI